MPKELEEKLKKKAKAKGLGKKRTGAYVYGTLRKTGWKPEREQMSDKKKKKSKAERVWADIKKKVGKKIRKALASGTTKRAILERRKAEKREGTIKRGPGAWTGRWEHQKHKKKKKGK